MDVNTYLIIILVIVIGEFLINFVISLLDFYHKPTSTHPSIKKDYIKAKRYLRSGIKFSIFKGVFDLIILLIIILIGGLNYLDIFVRSFGYGPILTGILFFGVIGLVCFIIDIPFKIFNIFYIENKY